MVDEKKRRRIRIRDRIRIQACLESGMPPSKIAEDTGFSKSAICREVSSRSTFEGPREMRCRQGVYVCNRCGKRAHCHRLKAFYDYASADLDAEDQARPVGPPHPRDRPGGRRDMLREDPKAHPVRRAALGEGP